MNELLYLILISYSVTRYEIYTLKNNNIGQPSLNLEPEHCKALILVGF